MLQKLDENIEEIPSYQAAFLSNRSVEDHIFTAKRIMEEYWNHGENLYVFSLDLKQAFDSVNQTSVVNALRFLKVPNYLINRIVRLGMKERTSLRWKNQKTPIIDKGKGVKQGCPLSPRLFTIVLHHILMKLKDKFPGISIGQGRTIRLPVILAYADDILIISKDLAQLDEIVDYLKGLLLEAGLQIHSGKSELIIRDPLSTKEADEGTYKIASMDIKAKPFMRYLGAYLTGVLDRPENVKRRCSQGVRASKMLLPFLQKNKPPWNLVRNIYSSVIVPTITFGLNAMALTSRNRRTLRRIERKIVQEWYRASGGKDNVTTRSLLIGRTIVKKVKAFRILYWGHIVRREGNHLLQAAYKLNLSGPLRKCRPCDTWLTTLDKELHSVGKNRQYFQHMLKDREKLKTEVKMLNNLRDHSDSEESIEI